MFAFLIHPRVLTALALLLAGAGLSITAWQGPDNAMLVPRIVLTIWCVVALAILIGELIRRVPVKRVTLTPLPLLMAAILIAAIADHDGEQRLPGESVTHRCQNHVHLRSLHS